jgi:hypothetical protein
MKTLNVPVTTQEMEDFKRSNSRHIGGRKFLGRDNEGNPIYTPNRRMRREAMHAKR